MKKNKTIIKLKMIWWILKVIVVFIFASLIIMPLIALIQSTMSILSMCIIFPPFIFLAGAAWIIHGWIEGLFNGKGE